MKRSVWIAAACVIICVLLGLLALYDRYEPYSLPFSAEEVSSVTFHDFNRQETWEIGDTEGIAAVVSALNGIRVQGERRPPKAGGQQFTLEFHLKDGSTVTCEYTQEGEHFGNFSDGTVDARVSNLDLSELFAEMSRDENPRPEFDTVRVTYIDNTTDIVSQTDGPDIQLARETADPAVMDELWEMYANLVVYDINRPQGLPRYLIEYLKDGEVVDHWQISEDHVVNGGRFGGNHTLENTVEPTGNPVWYDRISELFELCE